MKENWIHKSPPPNKKSANPSLVPRFPGSGEGIKVTNANSNPTNKNNMK